MKTGQALNINDRSMRTADNNRAATLSARKRVDIKEILGGRNEAIIVHNGQDYCLRITRNDKLILTK